MVKTFLIFIPLYLFLTSDTGRAQTHKQEIGYTKIGSIEKLSPDLDKIIKSNAKIEVLAEGFKWTEGPVWVEKYNMLLFSDIPQNKIFKWSESNGLEEYLFPAGYTGNIERGGEMGSNGLILDSDENLILCQHGDRQIAKMDASLDNPQPQFISLAKEYKGRKFNSPNDVIQSGNGEIFFTDPSYGLADKESKEMAFNGVYQIDNKGTVSLLIDSIKNPNGIALTKNEKQLLVGNSDGGKPYIFAYDINRDGSLTPQGIAFDFSPYGGGPDGFKISKNGTMFSSFSGGILIIDKNYQPIGKINIPQPVSNCVLSADEKTLYITANHQILRVKMR